MVEATISRVRMRDLARPGRYRPDSGREAAWRRACASRRESGTEACSIAAALPSRPGAATSRPGDGDLEASTICAVASPHMATTPPTLDDLRTAGLADVDPEVASLLERELERQRDEIELIASENFTWPAMLEAVGSVPTNKYSEGYPGRRYYGGCEVVDEIEQLAIDRAKALFGAEHANVQPHAGAQTNMAVYFAALEPGDTILSLELSHGGHLTHGLKVNFSGRLYTIVHYGVSRETNLVDYDDVLALAKEHRPKLIVCGGSAYPRTVETWRFREIADEVGALLLCDMAHFAGLVAAGFHPNPVEHCDFVTSTTHKTLAGPRSGFVLCREEHAQAVDRAVFPGMQGGPLNHVIAAKAACFQIAASEAFRDYQRQVRANADALAEALQDGGLDVLTGGTDTHLLLVDLRRTEWSGKDAEERLAEVGITVNRNTVPFDERPPTVASGFRVGTPAMTMRGFDEDDFREVGAIICGALRADADVATLAARSAALLERRPLYPGLPRVPDLRPTRRQRGHQSRPRNVSHRPRHGGHASARAAQARAPAGRDDDDADVPAARERAHPPADLRGDEGPRRRGGRDRDAARAHGRPADLGEEGRGLPDPARGNGHARRRALARAGRARRLHRALPRRGDARAGRVLREAPGRHRASATSSCSTRCSRPGTRRRPRSRR